MPSIAGSAARVDRQWSRALIEQNHIPPVVAADDGVWSFLALVALPDLARWRFPEPGTDRYIGLADHVFGRLWWRASVLGADLIDGLGREPLDEDELVALFRRRDLVASPPVAQAIASFVLRSSLSGVARLALVKRVTLAVLRESPMIELDALTPAELDRLVERISADADSTSSDTIPRWVHVAVGCSAEHSCSWRSWPRPSHLRSSFACDHRARRPIHRRSSSTRTCARPSCRPLSAVTVGNRDRNVTRTSRLVTFVAILLGLVVALAGFRPLPARRRASLAIPRLSFASGVSRRGPPPVG